MKIINKIIFFCLACGGASALAQDVSDQAAAATPPAPPFPCEEQEEFAEFDFWVGSWDVHTADGTYAGSNVISREQRNCVLFENWTGAAGSTGFSINYLDKITNEWVQSWHAASGYQIIIRGGLTPDGMLLEGTIHYIGNATTLPFRALWTPLPDGRVRQFFEQSTDAGETWATWFEGFYTWKQED